MNTPMNGLNIPIERRPTGELDVPELSVGP